MPAQTVSSGIRGDKHSGEGTRERLVLGPTALSGGAGDWQSLGRVLGSWIGTMFRGIFLGAMYTDAIAAATLGSVVLASKLGIGLITDLNACSIQTRRRCRRWSGSWMCAPRRRLFVEN